MDLLPCDTQTPSGQISPHGSNLAAPHHAAPAVAVPTALRETLVPEASVTEPLGQGRRLQPAADTKERCDFHRPIPSKARQSSRQRGEFSLHLQRLATGT